MSKRYSNYWHATPMENLDSILDSGIHTGVDGVVYLAETNIDAVKFLAIRGNKEILAIQVVVDEADVEESFDHNERFFKCKAFMCYQDIPPEACIEFMKYEF